ncbi:hypothetical protein IQ277_02755 [Nostocales cyanobacterium LEGE 12452]|nr:hypothetical protein [Nostocales cyanobacterium LEGE 12452]
MMKFFRKFAPLVLASVLGVSCFPDQAKAVSFSLVSAVARKSEQLDLFVVGNDGRVYTSWWQEGVGDWSGVNNNWRPIGGFFPVDARVSAVARRPGILDLFVVGNDGRVYTSWWQEGVSDWSGINNNWRSIGGFFPVPQ